MICIYTFHCQEEEKQRLIEDLKDSKDKARRRSLGNIKFIGELFKLKMLTEVIMHDCIVKLLKNHDDESLECLCRLLSTIGKDLDFEKAKVQNTRTHRESDGGEEHLQTPSYCILDFTWKVLLNLLAKAFTYQKVVLVFSLVWTSTSIRWRK